MSFDYSFNEREKFWREGREKKSNRRTRPADFPNLPVGAQALLDSNCKERKERKERKEHAI